MNTITNKKPIPRGHPTARGIACETMNLLSMA